VKVPGRVASCPQGLKQFLSEHEDLVKKLRKELEKLQQGHGPTLSHSAWMQEKPNIKRTRDLTHPVIRLSLHKVAQKVEKDGYLTLRKAVYLAAKWQVWCWARLRTLFPDLEGTRIVHKVADADVEELELKDYVLISKDIKQVPFLHVTDIIDGKEATVLLPYLLPLSGSGLFQCHGRGSTSSRDVPRPSRRTGIGGESCCGGSCGLASDRQ